MSKVQEHIRRLEGAQLVTLHDAKPFVVAAVTDNYVRVLPQSGMRGQRTIPLHQIERIAALGLRRDELRRRAAEEFPTSQNTSYIAALAFDVGKL